MAKNDKPEQYGIENPDGNSAKLDRVSKQKFFNETRGGISEASSLDTKENLSYEEFPVREGPPSKSGRTKQTVIMNTTGVKAALGVAVATSSAVVVGVVYAVVALILNVSVFFITPNSITFLIDVQNIGDRTIVANLSGEDGAYSVDYVVTDSGYFTYEKLKENTEYTLRVYDSTSDETVYKSSFMTPSTAVARAEIVQFYAHEDEVFVGAYVYDLKADEFYTLTLSDESGKAFYSIDSVDGEKFVSASYASATVVSATVKINGKVVAFDSLTIESKPTPQPDPQPEYNVQGAYWTWDGETAYLVIPKKEDTVESFPGEMTLIKDIQPTCETTGIKEYGASFEFLGETYTDSKEILFDALGHDYSAEFEWGDSEDGSGKYAATTTLICSRDPSHKQIVAASIDSVCTATCEENGETTYTAIVEWGGAYYYDEKIEDAPALGHDYQPEFVWTAISDGFTAACTLVCSRDNKHAVDDLDVELNVETSPADCENDGITVYIARAYYDEIEYVDKKEIILTALGHDFSFDYEITEGDNGEEVALGYLFCERCELSLDELPATMEFVSTTAECGLEGQSTYNISLSYGGQTFEATYEEDVMPLGHSISDEVFKAALEDFEVLNYLSGENNFACVYVCLRCGETVDYDSTYDIGFEADHAAYYLACGDYEAILNVPYEDAVFTYAPIIDEESVEFKITGLKETAEAADDKTFINTPDTLFGKPITTIGEGAFTDSLYKNVGVSINTVLLERGAFKNNIVVESVEFQGRVAFISEEAFMGCTNLQGVSAVGVGYVGDYAFKGCSSAVYVPTESAVHIGKGAYAGMTTITNINVCFDDFLSADPSNDGLMAYFFSDEYEGDTLEVSQRYSPTADSVTFYYPRNIEYVTVTRGPVIYGAFMNLPVVEVTIGDEVNYIDCSAFLNCEYLTALITSGDWDVIDKEGGNVTTYTHDDLEGNALDYINYDAALGYTWVRATD